MKECKLDKPCKYKYIDSMQDGSFSDGTHYCSLNASCIYANANHLGEVIDMTKLETQITEYAKAYYEGESLISDVEFDKLIEQLRKEQPDSPLLTTVGWGGAEEAKTAGSKVAHKYGKVVGLEKIHSLQELKFAPCYAAPKLDGLSCVLYCKEDESFSAVTRGNGKEGVDQTSKLRIILGKNSIAIGEVAVRGELVISKEDWIEKVQFLGDFSNPRNTVAGVINGQDDSHPVLKYIKFVPYKVEGGEAPTSYTEILTLLKSQFEVTAGALPLNATTVEDLEQLAESSPFPTDGVVLYSDEVSYNEDKKAIYQHIAYKFEDEVYTTTLTALDWQMSSNGSLTPVARFEAVDIDGVNVQAASAFNAKFVEEQGLSIGSQLQIKRANGVIPYIMKVESVAKANLPTHCPYCNAVLERVGVDIKCTATNCINKDKLLAREYLQVLTQVRGMANSKLDDLLSILKVTERFHLHNTTLQEKLVLIDSAGLREATTSLYKKVVKKFHEEHTEEEFWQAVSIEDLGVRQAERLIGTVFLQRFINNEPPTLEEFKQTKAIAPLYSRLLTLQAELIALYKHTKIIATHATDKEASPSDPTKTFAVTGTLSIPRKEFTAKAKEKGFLEVDVKKARYLVTTADQTSSTKYKVAVQLNKEIVSEEEFYVITSK